MAKAIYDVRIINTAGISSPEEFQIEVDNAIPHYCNGLEEVFNYCGGKLHRYSAGYAGQRGNWEYIATRVPCVPKSRPAKRSTKGR